MSSAGYWASKPIAGVQREEPVPLRIEPERAPTETGKPLVRPKQYDCRYEPPYPGHFTITMAISDPDRCVHQGTNRCFVAYPHLIAECGEFKLTSRDLE